MPTSDPSHASRLSVAALAQARALVEARIAAIPDFPKTGILFRDLTPVLADPQARRAALALHLEAIADLAGRVDKVVGIESRGFLFGVPVADRLEAGFVPVRKAGKLPRATLSRDYELEYGTSRLELHVGDLVPGDRVLIIDDLLATGGTAKAALELIQVAQAEPVGALFMMELCDLGGRARLGDLRVDTVVRY